MQNNVFKYRKETRITQENNYVEIEFSKYFKNQICFIVTYVLFINALNWGQQTFSGKGQRVNIFGSVGYMISVATTQLCRCGVKKVAWFQ